MDPRDDGPARVLALGCNRSGQLSLAAPSHSRQHCTRLGASEDGVEELVLPLSLDEAHGDLGAAAEANPCGGRAWLSVCVLDVVDAVGDLIQAFVSLLVLV